MSDTLIGYIDSVTFCPMIKLKLLSPENAEMELAAIIDTGHNGALILPRVHIENLNWEFVGSIDGELANGEIVETPLYRGWLVWFGGILELAVGTTESNDALLGTLLLHNCRLDIDFARGKARIARQSKRRRAKLKTPRKKRRPARA